MNGARAGERHSVERAEDGADSEWEYAPLRIPAGTSRSAAAAHLSLQAEFAGWELARVVRYMDGTRRVTLRRRRSDRRALPLPWLSY